MSDKNLVGAKGDSKPEESTNTLRSKSVARVLDLLSEGPIKGLVGDKKGVYINEVAWQRDNNIDNFDGMTADLRYGDTSQDPINGFPAIEREISDVRQITYGNIAGQPALQPEIQINDYLVDAVRVTIQVPALLETEKDGDVVGNSVTIKLEVKNALTAYSVVVTDRIAGKSTSPYERSYRIKLPKDATDPSGNYGFPCKIRVSRLTPDSDKIKIQNSTQLSHYTEIIDHKLSYPDTAYIGMTFDCKLFTEGVPQRLYHLDGLKMSIPSNYYPYGMPIENNMPLSSDFTPFYWAKGGISPINIANNIVSPDGTLTAQALVPTTALTYHYININSSTGISVPAAINYVSSVYVKQINPACTNALFIVYAYNSGVVSGYYAIDFSFVTNTGIYGASLGPGGQNVGWGVDNVGNGWYRLWLAGYPSATVPDILPRLLLGTNAGYQFAGNGTSPYASAWGFQIHPGKTPYQYLANTGYNKVTGTTAARYYDGNWDGTFKIEWTNNPAWILYMLLTHTRIGLGQWITENLVDKWSLYSLGKYCDELVPDGFGGYEPRFTYNGVIRNREEAYNVIQNIATVFRGIVYWGAGSTLVSWDAPKDASILVTPANVIDGIFDYKGVGWNARHSAALVKWNDPNNLYKDAVEVVEDQDLILKYGWKPIETSAVGCTSRGQAYRWGKWILYTEKYETETVTYKASFDHMIADGTAVMPGDIIKIMDPSYAGVRNGGRITEVIRNHLLYGSQFDSWNQYNVSTSPNTITREGIVFDQITENTVNSEHFVWQDYNPPSSFAINGQTYNYSLYLTRPDTNSVDYVYMFIVHPPAWTSNVSVVIDFVNGTILNYSSAADRISNLKMELIGGTGQSAVYRVSFDFIDAGGSNSYTQIRLQALDATINGVYAGSGRSFYAARAQVTTGSGVREYIDTTTTNRQALIVDSPVSFLSQLTYTISAVLPTGAVEDRTLVNSPGISNVLILSSPFSTDPIVGAMWIVSSPDLEPRLFRVLSVREQEKNVIEVTALYHNPNKFAMVEQGLTFETPNFSVLNLDALSPPTNFQYKEYLYRAVGGSVQSAVSLSWTPPGDGRVTAYEVQIYPPNEDWQYLDTTTEANYTHLNAKAGTTSFRVRSTGLFGAPSTWQIIDSVQLFGLSTKPPPVTNFNMNAIGDQAYLTWDAMSDPSVDYFMIKTQNVVTGAQWGNGIALVDKVPGSDSHIYVPLRFGTYMIKSVSVAGVESATATFVVSDVANINNFNATDTVIAEPAFAGTKTNCTVSSGILMTTATAGLYPAEAIYALSYQVDLGDIYTNRLTPTVSAAGQRSTYVMATWGYLNLVERLDGGVEGSWGIAIEYATTKMAPATATDWSEWRPLIIGDSTARGYKFRIRLLSYDTSVQVRVSNLKIVVDMPDRVEGQQGVTVPATAPYLNVTFANPFKVTPATAITIQNAATNEVAILSNESPTGFTVGIKNTATGTYVSKTINWLSKGYGKK